MVENSSRPSDEPSVGTSRIRTGQGVLFRMVAGHVLIGLLVLIAILISAWQLNTYNNARQAWTDTQERLKLIANARKDSTVLVLVIDYVVITREPFRNIEPETPRGPADSITVRIDDLEGWQKRLEQDAASLPITNPTKADLSSVLERMNELIAIAAKCRNLVKDENWEASRALIKEKSPDSDVTKINRFHINLLKDLDLALIFTQQDAVIAQDQMEQAGATAIAVTVSVMVLVILLGIVLSITIIRQITTPIHELSRAATRLASGDFAVHVPAARQDEFGHLAKVFNDMAAKLGEINARKEQQIVGMNQRIAEMDQQIRDLRVEIEEKVKKIVGSNYFGELVKKRPILLEIINSK